MDETLRSKERRLEASPDASAEAALLRERMRTGQVTEEQVVARAADNDPVALAVLGVTLPQARLLRVLGGRSKPRNTAEATRAIVAYYEAMGFQGDKWGALVGQHGDKTVRMVFKPRVVEEHHGRPGAWRKAGSRSLIQHAESLLASARGEAGKTALRERRKVEESKAKVRKSKEERKRNVLRAAAVLLSTELTPDERFEAILYDDRFESRAKSIAVDAESQLSDDATREQIDAMLSVSTPPIFLPVGRRSEDWPTSYEWRDPDSGFPIEVSRKGGRSIAIMIGNVPVDPITGSVDPLRLGVFDDESKDGYTGIAGAIRVGIYTDSVPQAQLYMIQSARRREGTARRMIRVFCRMVHAYGLDYFVVMGVNEESTALILGLDREGELKIVGRDGSNVFVKCLDALGDPRQQRLFGDHPKLNR